eukprot:m.12556 g.12556  ORF g.12556 m.12556 type:complete len:363 (+) comp4670_c0_seq1:400-1488(+)
MLATNSKKRSREMMDKFSRHLECPVCQEIMKNVHIHMCKQGHSVCGSCYNQMKNLRGPFKCSVCRGPMSNVRNIALESLVNDAPLKCENGDCSFIGTKEDIADHNSSCEYRPHVCPSCDWSGSVDEIAKHVEDEHEADYFTKEEDTSKTEHSAELRVQPNFSTYEIDMDEDCVSLFQPRVVELNQEHFIISAKLNYPERNFQCVVRHVSNNHEDVEDLDDLCDYIWTAKMSPKMDLPTRKIEKSFPMQTIRADLASVYEGAECFTVTKFELNRILEMTSDSTELPLEIVISEKYELERHSLQPGEDKVMKPSNDTQDDDDNDAKDDEDEDENDDDENGDEVDEEYGIVDLSENQHSWSDSDD